MEAERRCFIEGAPLVGMCGGWCVRWGEAMKEQRKLLLLVRDRVLVIKHDKRSVATPFVVPLYEPSRRGKEAHNTRALRESVHFHIDPQTHSIYQDFWHTPLLSDSVTNTEHRSFFEVQQRICTGNRG